MKRHFDRIHCTGCGNCIRFCPKGILKLSEEPDEQGIYHFGKSTTPDQPDQTLVNCLNLFDAGYTV